MASWWSLVNCWGRRDTRAKKIIVIEHKSHQIKKAVTECCTNRDRGGHADTWQTQQNARTWPGKPMVHWEGAPSSFPLLGSLAAHTGLAGGNPQTARRQERPAEATGPLGSVGRV